MRQYSPRFEALPWSRIIAHFLLLLGVAGGGTETETETGGISNSAGKKISRMREMVVLGGRKFGESEDVGVKR